MNLKRFFRTMENLNEQTVLPHDSQTFKSIWKIVDDQVMGGRSQSFVVLQDGYAKFHGTTNTNGGGFCSTRTQNLGNPINLSSFKGITVNVRSSQNFIYKFGLFDKAGRDVVTWQSNFEIEDGMVWQQIKIPFSSFQPTWRGQIKRKFKDFNVWIYLFTYHL